MWEKLILIVCSALTDLPHDIRTNCSCAKNGNRLIFHCFNPLSLDTRLFISSLR